MARSLKKGPFVDGKLLKKVQKMNEGGKKKVIRRVVKKQHSEESEEELDEDDDEMFSMQYDVLIAETLAYQEDHFVVQ